MTTLRRSSATHHRASCPRTLAVWSYVQIGIVGVCFLIAACSKAETSEAGPFEAQSAAKVSLSSQLAASNSARPSPPPKARAKPPYNVLLLMVDSLRADMPWTGYPREIAPWLTRFQKRCMTYTQGYALSSYTAKSVIPALVGEYPSAMTRDGKFFTRYPDEANLLISERAQQAGHRTFAGHAHGYFMPALGNNQGFDDYRLIPGGVDLKAVESVTSPELTQLAKQMLSDPKNTSLPDQTRFFAYFHYMDPHHTYEKHQGHPDFGNKPRDLYDNEVHFTDQHIGELVDFALAQPWGKQTAVIITADHGEGFGENNHFRHAYELWEPLVKVPLIICVSGAEPRRSDVRRSHIDLAPTIAELMGLSPSPPFRGKSLVGEVFGDPIEPRTIVVDLPRADLMDRRRAFVTKDGYKLIGFGDDTSFKLFNLNQDPMEEHDLAKQEPERLEVMKQSYREVAKTIPNRPVVGGAKLKGAPPGRRW